MGRREGSENKAGTILGLGSWKTHNHNQSQTELYIYKCKDDVLEGRKDMKLKTEVVVWKEAVAQGLLHLMQYSPASLKKKKSYMV